MARAKMGEQLRKRILRYLLDREHALGSKIPKLGEIAQNLGVSEAEISDQLDILDARGAIRANRTLNGGAAPILTGEGKAMLEELEEKEVPLTIEPTQEERASDVPIENQFEWDVFISHATEDKESLVRELADRLIKKGIRVWYDEFTLRVGDSLRRSIDKGLAKSQYGIVVLSHSFFQKEWPQKELDGLVGRERNGKKVILPIWLDVNQDDVASYSPMLADRRATEAKNGMDKVVAELLRVLKPNSSDVAIAFPVAKNESPAIVDKMVSTSTKLTKYKKYLPNAGQLKSTVFFNERVSKAFPGIRGLHIIDNSEEAVNRLCILLHAPLEFIDYSPIWMLFRQGSREINDCKGINGSHILIEPHELNIRKLAVYRGRVYWQDFVYIECAPDKPTGLYPHLTKEYINQFVEDTDMVSYAEEYAIWKDQLLTRAEYDDASIFRNGKNIPTTGARLRIRYLTPANIVIAAQLSPIHDLRFDRQRRECLDQLLRDQMALEEFVEVVEHLPKHTREL